MQIRLRDARKKRYVRRNKRSRQARTAYRDEAGLFKGKGRTGDHQFHDRAARIVVVMLMIFMLLVVVPREMGMDQGAFLAHVMPVAEAALRRREQRQQEQKEKRLMKHWHARGLRISP